MLGGQQNGQFECYTKVKEAEEILKQLVYTISQNAYVAFRINL